MAPLFYQLWWLWQLFTFTRREGFPRARVLWWIFVPIYGWVVLFRQFDDLEERAGPVAPAASFNPTLAVWLVILSGVGPINVGRLLPGPFLIVVIVQQLLFAAATFLVQRRATAYLAVKYPGTATDRISCGEIVAAVLGTPLLGLFVLHAAAAQQGAA